MLQSAFVAYDGSDSAQAALETACHLAGRSGGVVHVGYVIELPTSPMVVTSMIAGSMDYMASVPPAQTPEELESEWRSRKEFAKGLFERARATCERSGVRCETHCLNGRVEEVVCEQARGVDLVALGKGSTEWIAEENGERDESERVRENRFSHHIEQIVRNCPRPVLVASAPFRQPDRIILFFHGCEHSLRALEVAAELGKLLALPLKMLTVAREEARAKEKIACGRHYLNDHEVDFEEEFTVTEESPDRVLKEQVEGQGDALILMGGFTQPRLKQWLTGSTTRTMLKETGNTLVLTHR